MQNEGTPAIPRRVKVAGRRGIYYRVGADGKRRYEFDYYGSDGKRRWLTVDGDLRAAEAAREEMRGKLRRGERVATTRATVAEYAPAWLEAQANVRPRTIEKYRGAIDVHIIPRLGRLRLGDVTEEHIALLVADMQREGYAGWTIRGILTPLGRILGHAARRGVIASNPMSRLERGERPVATAVFTGLRLGRGRVRVGS